MSGNNIRKLRKQRGLTQQELAERVGLTKYNISDYEIGRTEPDIHALKALSEFFGVSIDFLLGVSSEHNTSGTKLYNDDFIFALYGEVKELTEKEKQDILDIVKILKRQGEK